MDIIRHFADTAFLAKLDHMTSAWQREEGPDDWDKIFREKDPRLTEVHRGIQLWPDYGVYQHVNNQSIPPHERAAALLGHIGELMKSEGRGIGMSWTDSPSVARQAAGEGGWSHHGLTGRPGRDSADYDDRPAGMPVVLNAEWPRREHIETDEHILGRHGTFPYESSMSQGEVPIRHGAPVKITGISWAPGNGERDKWTDHVFDRPVHYNGTAFEIPGRGPENERSINHVTGFREEGVSTYELDHHGYTHHDFGTAEPHTAAAQPGHDGYWRVHPDDRPFDAAHATSRDWGEGSWKEDGDHDQGFSAMRHPRGLYSYFGDLEDPEDESLPDPSHVVHFHGREVGEGQEGEPLVIPDLSRPVRRMSWQEFKHGVVGTEQAEEIRRNNGWSPGPGHAGCASQHIAAAHPGDDVVDLYHYTYPESAEAIYRERRFVPGTDEDRVYFTSLPSGGSGEKDYGPGVVHLRMPRHLVNDWGPDASGEHYYDVDPDDIRDEHFAEPPHEQPPVRREASLGEAPWADEEDGDIDEGPSVYGDLDIEHPDDTPYHDDDAMARGRKERTTIRPSEPMSTIQGWLTKENLDYLDADHSRLYDPDDPVQVLHDHASGRRYLINGNHKVTVARTRGLDRPMPAIMTHVNEHHTAAARPGRGEKTCKCCKGNGEHPDGSECDPCDGSGLMHRENPDIYCPGQPQPRRRHWRQAAMPKPDYDPSEELPTGRGVYYRMHLRGTPLDQEHAASRPVGGWNYKLTPQQKAGLRGYSAFDNPHHLHRYMAGDGGWEEASPDWDERDVIAFHGKQSGRGHDNELLVVPEASPACCGRVIHSQMPWEEFTAKLPSAKPLDPRAVHPEDTIFASEGSPEMKSHRRSLEKKVRRINRGEEQWPDLGPIEGARHMASEVPDEHAASLLGHFEGADGDYRGQHTAPGPEHGHLPLHHYTGDDPDDRVRIYRSAPAGTNAINRGDWVSLSADYAHQHGRHATDPSRDWPVYTAEVPQKHVHWDENDDNEHGYNGPDIPDPDVHDEDSGRILSAGDYDEEHPSGHAGWIGSSVHLTPEEHETAHDEFGTEDDRARAILDAAHRQGATRGARWHPDYLDAFEDAKAHADAHPAPEGHRQTIFALERRDDGSLGELQMREHHRGDERPFWKGTGSADLDGWHVEGHPALEESEMRRHASMEAEAASKHGHREPLPFGDEELRAHLWGSHHWGPADLAATDAEARLRGHDSEHNEESDWLPPEHSHDFSPVRLEDRDLSEAAEKWARDMGTQGSLEKLGREAAAEHDDSGLPELHRGVAVKIPAEDHAIISDESRPVHERAQHLLDHITRDGTESLGQHWTTSPGHAEYFTHYNSPPQGSPGSTRYSVVFHAAHPGEDAVIRDPAWRAEHEVNDSEDEVPVEHGTDMEVRGISWREGGLSRDPWITHRFDQEGAWHTAALEAAGPEYGPKPEFRAAPEHLSDDEKMEHWEGERQKNHAWEAHIRRGLSLGHLDYGRARELGYYGDGSEYPDETYNHEGNMVSRRGWQPLPEHLYHVTTDMPSVRQHGLKTRRELSQIRGKGLGGGPDDTISLTSDYGTAQNILRAMHEHHDVATGKKTPAQLVEEARTGHGAERPFLHEMAVYHGEDWNEGEPLPRRLDAKVRGVELKQGGYLHTPQEMAEREGPGWRPHPESDKIDAPKGTLYNRWERDASPETRREHASSLYRDFAVARAHAGGPEDPLFTGTDVHGFAAMDPSRFGIVHVRPRPGAQGFPVSALSEWRTATGDALETTRAERLGDGGHMVEASLKQASLANPLTGGTDWYHGTQAHPEDLAHGFADPMHDDENAWNARLGTHFTSDHELGRWFAKGEHNMRRDDNGDAYDDWDPDEEPDPSVVHARLHLNNPKVYASEHDMDNEAYEHEFAAGNHPSRDFPEDEQDREWDEQERPGTYEIHREWGDNYIPAEAKSPIGTRNAGHPVRQIWLTTHPDAQGIAQRFKQRLIDQGHDGIVYGNAWEHGPAGMKAPSAIAFDPDRSVEITQHHGDQQQCAPESGHTAARELVQHFATGKQQQLKLFHMQPDPTWNEPESGRHNPEDPESHLRWRAQHDEEYEPDECEHCGADRNLSRDHAEEHAAWLAHQDWHTDWDAEGIPGKIHRGIGVELPEHVSSIVHDESRPVRERAHALMSHVLGHTRGLGNFWSADPDVSKTYAEGANRGYGGYHTPVMFHARGPEAEHVETDPDQLREWGVYSYHLAGNREVPLSVGAPVHLTGVSWASRGHQADGPHPSDPKWADNGPHRFSQDPAWTHHEFGGEGIRATASGATPPEALELLAHFDDDEGDSDWDHPEYGRWDDEHGLYRHPDHGYHCSSCQDFHADPETVTGHQTAYTDWDSVYPYLPEQMHRGMAAELPPAVHAAVHDESRSPAERGRALLEHLQGANLGTHWSPDKDQAEHYSTVSASGRGPDATEFVLHARRPDREHIETDPDTLARQDVIGYGDHDDQEIPLREDAPVHITGVSWRRAHPEAAWTTHHLPHAQEHVAAAVVAHYDDDDYDDEDTDDYTTCDQGHEHWGTKGAAGLLIRHHGEDGQTRYLLQHRSPFVQHGDTWSTPGGAIARGESPEQAARREATEELGELPSGLTHHHTHTDDHGGWAYHTVVMDSPHRFTPHGAGEHSWESEGSGWFTPEEMKGLPLHPGFRASWENVRKSGALQGGPEQRSTREERSDRWHEFANRYSEDLHRGILVHLPDELHDYVHDEAVPREDRAKALSDHFSRDGLGMHWSGSLGQAQRAIANAGDDDESSHGAWRTENTYGDDDKQWYRDNGYEDYGDEEDEPSRGRTEVIFHGTTGERNRLRDKSMLDRYQVGSDYSTGEDEFPVKPGSPVKLNGISWRSHDGFGPFEHVDFPKPVRHTSSRTASVIDTPRGPALVDTHVADTVLAPALPAKAIAAAATAPQEPAEALRAVLGLPGLLRVVSVGLDSVALKMDDLPLDSELPWQVRKMALSCRTVAEDAQELAARIAPAPEGTWEDPKA